MKETTKLFLSAILASLFFAGSVHAGHCSDGHKDKDEEVQKDDATVSTFQLDATTLISWLD